MKQNRNIRYSIHTKMEGTFPSARFRVTLCWASFLWSLDLTLWPVNPVTMERSPLHLANSAGKMLGQSWDNETTEWVGERVSQPAVYSLSHFFPPSFLLLSSFRYCVICTTYPNFLSLFKPVFWTQSKKKYWFKLRFHRFVFDLYISYIMKWNWIIYSF